MKDRVDVKKPLQPKPPRPGAPEPVPPADPAPPDQMNGAAKEAQPRQPDRPAGSLVQPALMERVEPEPLRLDCPLFADVLDG